MSVVMPKGRPMSEKNVMNTMPRMISGIMMGSVERYSIGFLLRACKRVKATAPSVPIKAAQTLEHRPSTMLLMSA